MRYTRYDLKGKKKNGGFKVIIIFCVIIALSFVIGSFIWTFLVKDSKSYDLKAKQGIEQKTTSLDNKNVKDSSIKNIKYVAIQGGMYAKKENVDEAIRILSEFGNPFCIQEENATRVFLGIYSEKEGDKVIKNLTAKNIDNSKMLFEFLINDFCDEEINELLNAYIQVVNKLSDKNVRAIKTDELKKWNDSLKEVDKKSKNYDILNELKNNIKKFPDELSKDKINENYVLVYNSLKKVIKK